MTSFSAIIKKHPEFEFLPDDDKREILRKFMSVFMDGYKKLDAEGKKDAEEKLFEFYGVKKPNVKLISAVGDIKTEIDELKNVIKINRKEGDTGRKKLLDEISDRGWEAKLDTLKDSIDADRSGREADIKKLLKEIAKNKPKGYEAKIEALENIMSEGRSERKELFSRLSEIKNDPIDLSVVTSGLKDALNESRKVVTTSLENISREISDKKPKKWVFTVERDHRDLITEIKAVEI